MEVGDPCFAHVQGYPWWPAIIVSKSDVGSKHFKRIFNVIFYGTHERASLGKKDLAVISPENIAKYCSSKFLRRKYFKEGVEEMKAEFPWIEANDAPLNNDKSVDQAPKKSEVTVKERGKKTSLIRKMVKSSSKTKSSVETSVESISPHPLVEITNVTPKDFEVTRDSIEKESVDVEVSGPTRILIGESLNQYLCSQKKL